MNIVDPARRIAGLSLRHAALVAGIAYLVMPVAFAEFYIFPKLVIAGDIEHTVQNIAAHGRLFFVGILCHFVTLVLDVVIAWALYVLLAPANQALSLLAAWFRIVYAAVYLADLDHLLFALHLVNTPSYRTTLGKDQWLAQVQFQLGSFRHSLNLAFFGIHLILLGYLIYQSGYIPKLVGIVLGIVGASWMINSIGPHLFPGAQFDFLSVLGIGELLLPLWLLIRGRKLGT